MQASAASPAIEQPSSLFNQIYQVAKKLEDKGCDHTAIRQELERLSPSFIYERDGNLGSTIAGELAKQGLFKAAEFFSSLASACWNNIIRGAMNGGYYDYVSGLLSRSNHFLVDEIAKIAIEDGHLNYVEKLWQEHHANVNEIAESMWISWSCDEQRISFSLADIKTPFREALAKALDDTTQRSKISGDDGRILRNMQRLGAGIAFNVTSLLPKANKIAPLKDPYAREWLLFCNNIMTKKIFPIQAFLSVLTMLCPLNYKEAQEAHQELWFNTRKKLLVDSVTQHCESVRVLRFFNRDKKAEVFSAACSRSETSDQIRGFLQQEHTRIKEKEQSSRQDHSRFSCLFICGSRETENAVELKASLIESKADASNDKSEQPEKVDTYKKLIEKHVKRFGI